jgi:hypothetical protein
MTETNPTNQCEAAASSPSNQTRIKLEEVIEHLAGCVRSHAMPSQPFGPKPCSLEDIEKSKGKIRLLVDGLLDELQAVEKELRERSGDLERIRSLVPGANGLMPTFDVIRGELAIPRVFLLQKELTQLREAIGLMTTAKPDMQVDVHDPVGMAQQVVTMVERLRNDGMTALNEALKQKKRAEDVSAELAEVKAELDKRLPNLTAEAKIAIAAMRDVGPELVKAGIQMGPRLSHGEAVAQLRGERDRWREKCQVANDMVAASARFEGSAVAKLAEHGFFAAGGLGGLRRAIDQAMAELTRRRKECQRNRADKQQAMLDEIARLLPGKGPLLDRVRKGAALAKIGADVSNGKTAPSAWRERFMRLRDCIKAQIAWCTLPGGAPFAGMHKEHAVLSSALANADALLVEAAREGGASWLSAQGLLERRFPDAKPKQEDAVDGRRKLFEASVDAFADKIDRELMQHVPQFEGDPKDCALSRGNKLPEKPPEGAPSIVPKLDLELIGAHLRHAIDLLGKQK